MFDDLEIKEIFRCFVSPDDAWSRSLKVYCRLSRPVNLSELTKKQFYDFYDLVCNELSIYVAICPGPGQYFAHEPSFWIVGTRMIVYQYAGYDV